MLKKYAKLLSAGLLFAVVILAAGCGTDNNENNNLKTNSESVANTSYENKVEFVSKNKAITNLNFSWDGGYSVAKNQPWQGVTIEAEANRVIVLARAGRINNNVPANWFNSLASSRIGLNASSASPAELHFAFSGTLYINDSAYHIVLGQGTINEGNNNNWWIGSNELKNIENNRAIIETSDSRYVISASNNNYTFEVSPLLLQGATNK